MKKQVGCMMLCGLMAITALSACANSGGGSPVVYTDPPVDIRKVSEDAPARDDSGAEIELLSLDDPHEFSYSGPEHDMVFIKRDGAWYDEFNRNVPINQEKFTAMADNFLHLKAVERVADDGNSGYGLNGGDYSLYITDSGVGEVYIYIGNKDPEGNYYAMLDDGPVYTIKPHAVESLEFDYEKLVTLDSIDLQADAGMIKEASVYTGGKAVTYKASDKEAMARIAAGISALAPLEYSSYYATDDELFSAELTEELRSVFSARLEIDGQTRSLTVYIGCYPDPMGTSRYVRLEGSNMIFTADRSVIDDLTNGLMVTEEMAADEAGEEDQSN